MCMGKFICGAVVVGARFSRGSCCSCLRYRPCGAVLRIRIRQPVCGSKLYGQVLYGTYYV